MWDSHWSYHDPAGQGWTVGWTWKQARHTDVGFLRHFLLSATGDHHTRPQSAGFPGG